MDVVEEQLEDLGDMHTRYGVHADHYKIMGDALVCTLEKILGKRSFTETTRESWEFIFKFMTDAMLKGSKA